MRQVHRAGAVRVLARRIICLPYTSALYVCLICLPYVSALGVLRAGAVRVLARGPARHN